MRPLPRSASRRGRLGQAVSTTCGIVQRSVPSHRSSRGARSPGSAAGGSPAIVAGSLAERNQREPGSDRWVFEATSCMRRESSPPPAAPEEPVKKAPLFENIGDHHHDISSDSKLAQRYFDQGLTWAYAFNHAEAVRSFVEAARHDPECAICWWGAALALGPNINARMPDEDVPRAWEYLQKAKALAKHASEKERDYIEALSKRYVKEPVKDRHHLDVAYAEAMRKVAQKYPDDLDAQTLFAEAMMDTMPWDYWKTEYEPKPETKEILAALESVMKRDETHPGALHLYIHAVEASSEPSRGEQAADRLGDLVPIAGHLVHMPSHIYLRVGRYDDASEANVRAATADERYISECKAQGLYPAMYYPHNIHFLWYSSALEGRSQTSIESAEKLATKIPVEMARDFPLLQQFMPVPLFAYLRFGKWDDVLDAPRPDGDFAYATAMWHYARGVAFAARKDRSKAETEAKALDAIAESEALKKLEAPDFPAIQLVSVAREVIGGEIARADARHDEAIRRFTKAVELQDKIPYMEPPYWYFPVRHFLGAALLEAGKTKEAEAVYRKDLEKNPKNGWSLFGLAKSLDAQGKKTAAKEAWREFEKAWNKADVHLAASRF
jgi:tetratricopeptide (TPR) repeat protein